MSDHPEHDKEALYELRTNLAAVGPDAGDKQVGMHGDAERRADDKTGRRPFDDPDKARKAAQKRWEKQREKAANEPSSTEVEAHVLTVTVPVRVGTIIAALERKAAAGETQAARELRSWLSEYPPSADDELDPAQLDRALRRRILARLIAEDEAAQEAAR